MIINDTDRLKQVVDGKEADSLTIELVDMFKVKDLEMDLADKEVYQLINKTNNVEYYYNQIKNQLKNQRC